MCVCCMCMHVCREHVFCVRYGKDGRLEVHAFCACACEGRMVMVCACVWEQEKECSAWECASEEDIREGGGERINCRQCIVSVQAMLGVCLWCKW